MTRKGGGDPVKQLNNDQKRKSTGLTTTLQEMDAVHEERKLRLLNDLDCGILTAEAVLGQIEEMAREKKYLSQIIN